MQFWGISHKGEVRQQNQDSYACRRLNDGRVLAVVCDGMGGAKAGNIASSMAVNVFVEQLSKESGDWRERMQRAASQANTQVFQRAIQDEACAGMGTTIVAALVAGNEALILNEGDSRAYHINANGIVLVTRDHSYVEDLVASGKLTREEARNHPKKNLLTRALGAEPVLMADCFQKSVAEGDYLLLCSDGLSNMVTEQELLYEVIHGQSDETCCQRLLDIALQRGAPDNVTAVLIRC